MKTNEKNLEATCPRHDLTDKRSLLVQHGDVSVESRIGKDANIVGSSQ